MRNRIKLLITVSLLCVLAVLLYYNISNKTAQAESKKESETVSISEVDKMLAKNLDNNYPVTAKEVLSLFTRIQQCYYNEEYSQEELVKLAYMAMKLFDEQLIEKNPFDEYYEDLQRDIDMFAENDSTISRVILDKSSDIMYSTIDGVKYASINCVYYIKKKSGTEKTIETYILRKNEEDRWKILGWKLYEEPKE